MQFVETEMGLKVDPKFISLMGGFVPMEMVVKGMCIFPCSIGRLGLGQKRVGAYLSYVAYQITMLSTLYCEYCRSFRGLIDWFSVTPHFYAHLLK